MNNHEQQQHVISTNEMQPLNSVREYSDSIPVDILIEIFLRVPSKSIARFRCVSKFWRSILERPDFIELFRTRCLQILFILDVYTPNTYDKEEVFYSIPQHTNPNRDENSCVVVSRNNSYVPGYVPSKYVPSDYNTMLCGLFLVPVRNVCMICNHATREYITLPKVLSKDTKILPPVIPEIRQFFFGYDPISKLFKVLCMTSSNTHQVLTLENGKLKWRTIESKFDFMERYEYDIPSEICINGVLYFGLCFQGSSSIACFDVRSEKLSIINIGKDMVKEGPCTSQSITLISYKGKLGIHGPRGGFKLDYDLLVLEDAGNHKWSKHSYEFPQSWNKIVNGYMYQIVGKTDTGETLWAHELRIVGMTGIGEMVYAPIWLSNSLYVFYYNLERNTFTKVDIQGVEEVSPNKNTHVCAFVDYGENMKLFK